MLKTQTIRSFLAFLMLTVFTLGITPKSYLHDLFAGHTDTVTKTTNDGNEHISKTGFNCDCNSLVATSPFTDQPDNTKINSVQPYQTFFSPLPSRVDTSDPSFFELRGPPVKG